MLINLSAALWLNAFLENTGVLVLSSVFPDLIDYYTLNEYTWWEEHRGLSHFWAVYIAGYIAGTILLPPQSLEHFLYLITGCLLHIFMDFLTPMGKSHAKMFCLFRGYLSFVEIYLCLL